MPIEAIKITNAEEMATEFVGSMGDSPNIFMRLVEAVVQAFMVLFEWRRA